MSKMSNLNTNTKVNNKANSVKKASKKSLQAAQATVSQRKGTLANEAFGQLSRATTEYVYALADPFNGPLATIPDFPSVPSRRVRCFSRGFFSTGTSQIGFCVVDPYALMTNNVFGVYSTSSAYTGVNIAVTGAGVVGGLSNSDYAAADFGTGNFARARIVAFGLRIRYSSTELNRGGIALGIMTPNHTLLTGLNFTSIDGYECSGRFRPTSSWITVRYCPVYQDELIYSTTGGSPGGALFSSGYTAAPILGFIVQSPAADVSVSFEYEVFEIFELSGRDIRGLVPSVADPAGFAAVQTTVQASMMRPTSGDISQHGKKLVNAVHSVAHHTLTGFAGKLIDSGVNWIEREGVSLLGGLASLF